MSAAWRGIRLLNRPTSLFTGRLHKTSYIALSLACAAVPVAAQTEAAAPPAELPAAPAETTAPAVPGDSSAAPEPTAAAGAESATAAENSAPETPAAETPATESATPPGAAETAPEPAKLGQGGLPVAAQQPGRLFAESIRYEGSVIIAEGGAEGVRFEGSFGLIRAERLRIDTVARTLKAEGKVRVQRTREVARRQLMPTSVPARRRNETVTETLRGENLTYDFVARTGSLDNAVVELASFTISSSSIIINGQRYIARNVVLRPGGLTEAEIKIYGTPPFSLKAKTVTIDTGAPGSTAPPRAAASGAALYFKNTKILPVPSYVLKSVSGAGSRDKSAFSLTPRLTFNSTDRILLTTKLRFPLSKVNPSGAAVDADIGLSARIGLRGGLSVTTPTRAGEFVLSARVNDIVTTQLTNRIVLDREPEVTYTSPLLSLFSLPGGRKAGILVGAGIGRFGERTIGGGGGEIHDTRTEGQVVFTTRAVDIDGPYLDIFGRVADYSKLNRSYSSTGFEVGYYGNITRRVRGLFSYRSNSISGATPFRFDQIEIARELRTTFDIKLSPRYVIPIDLRYDLDLKEFRDESFGILRNYKNFAYGITYETARRELSLEVRSGF